MQEKGVAWKMTMMTNTILNQAYVRQSKVHNIN